MRGRGDLSATRWAPYVLGVLTGWSMCMLVVLLSISR